MVNKLADRRRVMMWMCVAMETEEVEELPAKAVDQFPTVFTARSRASNQR